MLRRSAFLGLPSTEWDGCVASPLSGMESLGGLGRQAQVNRASEVWSTNGQGTWSSPALVAVTVHRAVQGPSHCPEGKHVRNLWPFLGPQCNNAIKDGRASPLLIFFILSPRIN